MKLYNYAKTLLVKNGKRMGDLANHLNCTTTNCYLMLQKEQVRQKDLKKLKSFFPEFDLDFWMVFYGYLPEHISNTLNPTEILRRLRCER